MLDRQMYRMQVFGLLLYDLPEGGGLTQNSLFWLSSMPVPYNGNEYVTVWACLLGGIHITSAFQAL